MKKGIAIVIMLIVALSFALSGCGGGADDIATPDTGSTTGGADVADGDDTAGSDATGAESDVEPQEGYLDETTGMWHTTIIDIGAEISFSVPDGWQVMDSLPVGGGACDIWPTEKTTSGEDIPGVLIEYNLNQTNESVQAIYDLDERLGESQEVTYGDNTYISNVTPIAGSETQFYYTGKAAPVLYIRTTITDANQAALEEVLSTLTY